MGKLSYGPGPLQRIYDGSPVLVQHAFTSVYGALLNRRAYGPAYRRHYARAEAAQRLGREALERLQAEELRPFLAFAREHSAYWREAFERAGFDPAALRGAADLRALPPLEKETVRQHGERLVTAPARQGELPSIKGHTSGTTGKSLNFLLSREAWQREYAYRWLHRSWAGVRRGDRTATFAGQPVVSPAREDPPFWRYNWADDQLFFSSQHIGPATVGAYAERLRSFEPVLVHGYPSAVYLVAAHLVAEGIEDVRPKAVFTHSETLLDHQREAMERAFGCRVYNWYGTGEHVGNIVGCEHGRLHVKMDHSVLEFVRPDGSPAGPGETAELLATGFANLAMPLIRYRVGDTAVLSAEEACPCGRAGPLVERVTGRVEDFIVTPEGRHVGRLDHVFKDALNVFEAQLVQETVDTLDVRIVPRPGFGEADQREIERELRFRLGDTIRLRFHTVAEIPRGATGKFRFAHSRVRAGVRGALQPTGGGAS